MVHVLFIELVRHARLVSEASMGGDAKFKALIFAKIGVIRSEQSTSRAAREALRQGGFP
jgi:hypothetical protein